MNIRHSVLGLLAALLFTSGLGCRKSQSPPNTPPPAAASALSPDTVVRVHWQGKHALGFAGGAYYFSRLWDLPESERLQHETLDKLSTAPWRQPADGRAGTNEFSLLLRPLLNDVVENESYFEIRHAVHQPEQFVFAIRLDERHAGLWETNLVRIMDSVTGAASVVAEHRTWTLKRSQGPASIEMVRAGEWTILGAGREPNDLLRRISDRVRRDSDPFGARVTGYWLEADLDLQRLAGRAELPLGQDAQSTPKAFGAGRVPTPHLTPGTPQLTVTVTGDGGNVLVHGEVNFAQPVELQLAPWNIPTNRIAEPLSAFTVARGFKSCLESWRPWSDLRIGPPPNQLAMWCPDGVAVQTLLLVPDWATNSADALTGLLLQKGNPWLMNHGTGTFEAIAPARGVFWKGLPLISPFVTRVDPGPMVLCGLVAGGATTNAQNNFPYRPSLCDLFRDATSRTNLVYYDWEITGARAESCFTLAEVLRVAFRRPQLPLESAGAGWLRAIKDRLGTCTTTVVRTGPNQLAFDRKSNIGLTGAELNLLVDWLESPQFPQNRPPGF